MANNRQKPKKDSEEPRMVTVKGRATKRKIFFERHTGAGAQIIAAVVVLVALVSVFASRCDGKADDSSSSQPEPEPEAEPEPDPEPVSLAFTEAQVARLDEMLAAWAEEETLVDVTPKDEDGNPIGEQKFEEDGGHQVAVWFQDLDSGAQYTYNSQAKFSYASLMKAPYAAYLYQLAEAGLLDMSEELTVEAVHTEEYKENTGVLKEMDLPQNFTVEQVIGFMLRNSDTIAAKTLLQHWPADGFRAWAGEVGIEEPQELRGVLSGQISAADAGVLMQAVNEYIRTGQFGATLREHMLNTTNRMISSEWPVVRKYGWDEQAYHDMAIIESPHPAILVILTDKWGGSWAEKEMFGTVTAAIEGAMAELWAAQDAA